MSDGMPMGAGGPSLDQVVAQQRVVYLYQVPPELVDPADPDAIKEVGLCLLTGIEEVQAARRCGGDRNALAYEATKACLYTVNGSRVSLADGTADRLMNRMPPHLRSLLINEYLVLHTATGLEQASFRASRRVTTG